MGSRNFALLVTCDTTSAVGTSIALVATPFAVLAIGGSAGDMSYVTASAWVPMLLFLMVGGSIADRVPRHQLMMAANGVQAVAQAVSAALVLSGKANVLELMALAALRGFGLGFYIPAAAGLLPQTVQAHQLQEANAISRATRTIAQIVGAGLGGTLVAAIGPGWGLAADAASYAIAGAVRAGMHFSKVKPAAKHSGIVTDLRDGWREFISRRWLWVSVLQACGVTAAYQATISVLGPLVAHTHFSGARAWGLITAASAVGGLCGALTSLRFRPQRILLFASLSCLLLSTLLFALAVPLPLVLVATAAFMSGAGIEFFVVNQSVAVQQEIAPDMLSRVSSYNSLGGYVLAPIGIAVAGPLAAALGAGRVLAGGGVLMVLLTVAALCVPEIRHLHRRTLEPRAGDKVDSAVQRVHSYAPNYPTVVSPRETPPEQ